MEFSAVLDQVVGVNRYTRQVIFGAARWHTTITIRNLEALIEKGLLWLQGDTAHWEVHYAFFAKAVGQLQIEDAEAEMAHVFTPEDLTALGA